VSISHTLGTKASMSCFNIRESNKAVLKWPMNELVNDMFSRMAAALSFITVRGRVILRIDG
jgi:hypothetical protein